MTLSVALDILLVMLLGATVVYAAILHRRLTVWRHDHAEFERLIERFNRAATDAANGAAALKTASEENGRALSQSIAKAQSLRDDLQVLVERGEPLADRMTETVRAGRSTRPMPAPAAPTVETSPSGPRSISERELQRALAAIR
ncbi:MAG: hypothetical protein HY057_02895 [Rhodospirillales bacterium]|nr:hypothetical protein [Rhodospirillales bacterium]